MEFISKPISNRPLSALILFLVSFALYSPSLRSDFVWDDAEVIIKSNASFGASYERQEVQKDDLQLQKNESLSSPCHPLFHQNYGFALPNNGELDEAIREFVIGLSPEMKYSARGLAITVNNLAVRLSGQ